MKRESVSITYQVLTAEELTDAQKKLMSSAQDIVKTAYSPYSKYQVGAAILMADGAIIKGNNQENAVYPLGLCAERVALFNMGAQYPDGQPTMMALTVASENKPGFPCGSCRQAFVEFEQRYQCKIPLLIESVNNTFLYFENGSNLLPFAFDQSNLG